MGKDEANDKTSTEIRASKSAYFFLPSFVSQRRRGVGRLAICSMSFQPVQMDFWDSVSFCFLSRWNIFTSGFSQIEWRKVEIIGDWQAGLTPFHFNSYRFRRGGCAFRQRRVFFRQEFPQFVFWNAPQFFSFNGDAVYFFSSALCSERRKFSLKKMYVSFFPRNSHEQGLPQNGSLSVSCFPN